VAPGHRMRLKFRLCCYCQCSGVWKRSVHALGRMLVNRCLERMCVVSAGNLQDMPGVLLPELSSLLMQ
jgi:hypothetical protein